MADINIQPGTGITITGSDNDNIIVGTTGNDTISGKEGNDIILGGGGKDILTGNGGSDTFYFDPSVLKEIQALQAGTLSDIRDTITDFASGSGGDVIDVSSLLKRLDLQGKTALHTGFSTRRVDWIQGP